MWTRPARRGKIEVRNIQNYIPDRHIKFPYFSAVSKCGPPSLSRRWGITRVPQAAKTPSITGEYVRTVQTLIELLELPGGWNSYKATPIRKENVSVAVDLLGRLMHRGTPTPDVVPRVRGGVQLEWHTRGINLEITIDSPQEVSLFAEYTAGNREPIEGPLNESVAARWIDRISE